MSDVTEEKEAKSEKKEILTCPKQVNLNEFHEKKFSELSKMFHGYHLRYHSGRTKYHLIYELMSYFAKNNVEITASGILELNKDGYGFMRWPSLSYRPGPDDVYVASPIIQKHQVRSGQMVKAKIGMSPKKRHTLAIHEIIEIEGQPVEEWQAQPYFDKLTPLFPKDRIILENKELGSKGMRIVDLVAPLGKGQRGLIVAPPRGGKTILLKDIAKAIVKNHPEVELLVVLLDERPEEVTDFEETVPSNVLASTFDESPKRHSQVAELVIERAKRLVEQGKDVVILLDSLTRLARGYNNMHGSKGGIMSGGLSQKALQDSRKFFGSARNVEEGGSLTILATALIETEARMDDIIFEEFKGTGNMEVHLDRELAEKRIFPAIHMIKSGTRKDDELYHPDEYKKLGLLRRQLAVLPVEDGVVKLIDAIGNTDSNAELVIKGLP